MPNYRRVYIPGGTYFFTVVMHQRKVIFNNDTVVNMLHDAFQKVKRKHDYQMDAFVIMPDHLHCIWSLPTEDKNFSTRWRLIKADFSKKYRDYFDLDAGTKLWQDRFWEHAIRDEKDWQRHMDYIHYNRVKHGYVSSVKAWKYSSFRAMCMKGLYPET